MRDKLKGTLGKKLIEGTDDNDEWGCKAYQNDNDGIVTLFGENKLGEQLMDLRRSYFQ
jgi:predicted NAD-dependent protein-ADP-ribosyltransferase YbiA (DUF1768 family)